MQANAHDLTTVFAVRRQFFIPIFQRPYVWKQDEQWLPLWDDVTRIATHLLESRQGLGTGKVKPHFLGAIVLDQHPVPVGKPEARSVIDGQQRLTTIQLLLMALRDSLLGREECERFTGSLDELIYNKYVSDDDKLKVLPTNVDEAIYRAVANTSSDKELAALIEEKNLNPSSRIVEAYRFFHASSEKWIAYDTEDWMTRAEALVDSLRQLIRLVVIDMDDQDEAQVIFETLNARGTPLLEIDLVKNHVFRMAKDEGQDIEKLYKKHWQPFEDSNDFWRDWEIRQGRLKRPAIEVFLQHYLTMRLKDDVPATKLFDVFKEWSFKSPDKCAEWHLEQLRRYAVHFRHFMEVESSTGEGVFFKRLGVIETTTIFPFLLDLYERTSDNAELKSLRNDVLTTLESFLVRRMVVRLTTKNYNRLFVDLQQEIANSNPTDIGNVVRTFLLKGEGDSVRWPNDDEFWKAWLFNPLYNEMKQSRVRLLLRAVEDDMPNSRTEGVYIKERLTIEHVMPQSWEQHWPLSDGEDDDAETIEAKKSNRERIIQTLGNLTLLTQPLNSGVSNRPYSVKLEEILKYSKLNLNFQLSEFNEWDEDAIMTRSGKLFAVAKQLWPHQVEG
jgi:hypothetical protein